MLQFTTKPTTTIVMPSITDPAVRILSDKYFVLIRRIRAIKMISRPTMITSPRMTIRNSRGKPEG